MIPLDGDVKRWIDEHLVPFLVHEYHIQSYGFSPTRSRSKGRCTARDAAERYHHSDMLDRIYLVCQDDPETCKLAYTACNRAARYQDWSRFSKSDLDKGGNLCALLIVENGSCDLAELVRRYFKDIHQIYQVLY